MHVDYHGYRRNGKSKYEHRLIAEKALGRPLRKGEVVHHIDYDGTNNHPSNLVICNQATHMIIHARTDALRAGVSTDTHALCSRHKSYLPKDRFSTNPHKWNGVHNMCRDCTNEYRKERGIKTKWDDRAKLLQRMRRERQVVS